MKPVRNFFYIIRKSINYDTMESSTRIQGYLVMGLIYIMALLFCAIELTSFINTMFILHQEYKISTEIIIIFSSILAHHLGVLFNKRAGEKGDINDKMEDKLNSLIDNKLNTNVTSDTTTTTTTTPPTTTTTTTTPVHDSDLA